MRENAKNQGKDARRSSLRKKRGGWAGRGLCRGPASDGIAVLVAKRMMQMQTVATLQVRKRVMG